MEPGKALRATIHFETVAKLNFACHHSSLAYLRDLRIENNDPNSGISLFKRGDFEEEIIRPVEVTTSSASGSFDSATKDDVLPHGSLLRTEALQDGQATDSLAFL